MFTVCPRHIIPTTKTIAHALAISHLPVNIAASYTPVVFFSLLATIRHPKNCSPYHFPFSSVQHYLFSTWLSELAHLLIYKTQASPLQHQETKQIFSALHSFSFLLPYPFLDTYAPQIFPHKCSLPLFCLSYRHVFFHTATYSWKSLPVNV